MTGIRLSIYTLHYPPHLLVTVTDDWHHPHLLLQTPRDEGAHQGDVGDVDLLQTIQYGRLELGVIFSLVEESVIISVLGQLGFNWIKWQEDERIKEPYDYELRAWELLVWSSWWAYWALASSRIRVFLLKTEIFWSSSSLDRFFSSFSEGIFRFSNSEWASA